MTHVKEWLLVFIILVSYFIYRFLCKHSQTTVLSEDREDEDSSFTITSNGEGEFLEERVFTEEQEPQLLSSETDRALQEPHSDFKKEPEVAEDDLIILSIFAKTGHYFVSYELLQAITGAGLQFGEMNMFHYYILQGDKKITLFSLASMTKSGDFNLDRIGDYSCRGLTLFMKVTSVPQPEDAFSCMLEIAEQLADDLDGELRAGFHLPWTPELYDQYQEKISSLHYASIT